MSWQDGLVTASLVVAAGYLLLQGLQARARANRRRQACTSCPLAVANRAPMSGEVRTIGRINRQPAG